MSFPIIAGYKLQASELELARLWLGSAADVPAREVDTAGPREFSNGLNFLPRARVADLEDVIQWCRPLLILTGRETEVADHEEFFRLGAGACFALPGWDEPMLFPNPVLPEVKGTVFIVTDDGRLRSLYRQLLRFAGYEIRVDFRSADEIAETLEHIHGSETEDIRLPELILLDLDSSRVDVPKFFHNLKIWTRENPRARAALRVMVTRDFGKPGGDISGLAGAMRPFVRRIFHPHEALCALMEALLFRGPETGIETGHRINLAPSGEYRSLSMLLHGADGRPGARSPRELLAFARERGKAAARSLPFLWLHEHLNRDSVREGAVLAPQPGIDGGDFLHGVGGPHASGKAVQHPAE